MEPLIAITPYADDDGDRLTLPRTYARAVAAAGGRAWVLPYWQYAADDTRKMVLRTMLDRVDGLLLSGGADIDPDCYGREPGPALGQLQPVRDDVELALARQALALDLPVLGICRGLQTLNVACGGTLVQDIPTQLDRPLKHAQDAPRWHPTHQVTLTAGCRLTDIFAQRQLQVNSLHHQAADELAPDLQAVGHAPDGVVEACQHPDRRFTVAVQWHPEAMFERHPHMLSLFTAFTAAARTTPDAPVSSPPAPPAEQMELNPSRE